MDSYCGPPRGGVDLEVVDCKPEETVTLAVVDC
jgi:hypothetical protein